MDVTDEVCNFMMDGYIEDAVPSIYTVTLDNMVVTYDRSNARILSTRIDSSDSETSSGSSYESNSCSQSSQDSSDRSGSGSRLDTEYGR